MFTKKISQTDDQQQKKTVRVGGAESAATSLEQERRNFDARPANPENKAVERPRQPQSPQQNAQTRSKKEIKPNKPVIPPIYGYKIPDEYAQDDNLVRKYKSKGNYLKGPACVAAFVDRIKRMTPKPDRL